MSVAPAANPISAYGFLVNNGRFSSCALVIVCATSPEVVFTCTDVASTVITSDAVPTGNEKSSVRRSATLTTIFFSMVANPSFCVAILVFSRNDVREGVIAFAASLDFLRRLLLNIG